jgi:hypothetical protein
VKCRTEDAARTKARELEQFIALAGRGHHEPAWRRDSGRAASLGRRDQLAGGDDVVTQQRRESRSVGRSWGRSGSSPMSTTRSHRLRPRPAAGR